MSRFLSEVFVLCLFFVGIGLVIGHSRKRVIGHRAIRVASTGVKIVVDHVAEGSSPIARNVGS